MRDRLDDAVQDVLAAASGWALASMGCDDDLDDDLDDWESELRGAVNAYHFEQARLRVAAENAARLTTLEGKP